MSAAAEKIVEWLVRTSQESKKPPSDIAKRCKGEDSADLQLRRNMRSAGIEKASITDAVIEQAAGHYPGPKPSSNGHRKTNGKAPTPTPTKKKPGKTPSKPTATIKAKPTAKVKPKPAKPAAKPAAKPKQTKAKTASPPMATPKYPELMGYAITQIIRALGRLGWTRPQVRAMLHGLGGDYHDVSVKTVDTQVHVGAKCPDKPCITLSKRQIHDLTEKRKKGEEGQK